MLIVNYPKGYRPCRLQANVRLARPTVRRARVFRLQALNEPSQPDSNPSMPETNALPAELQDLAINEDGFLIDTKTGKVINEMGATRFDVAVRALRGELDPPSWVENSERTPGVILSALYQFPKSYVFQVVGRTTATTNPTPLPANATAAAAVEPAVASAVASSGSRGPCSPGQSGAGGSVGSLGAMESFVLDVTAAISRVTQMQVEGDKVEVKERLGGKYVSVAVEVVVRAPELVNMVYDELAKDPRVIMKF